MVITGGSSPGGFFPPAEAAAAPNQQSSAANRVSFAGNLKLQCYDFLLPRFKLYGSINCFLILPTHPR
jgi:hypothetical protein